MLNNNKCFAITQALFNLFQMKCYNTLLLISKAISPKGRKCVSDYLINYLNFNIKKKMFCENLILHEQLT